MPRTTRSRSSNGDEKPIQREKHGLRGAVLHVTSRRPQKPRKWVQTTIKGYTAVHVPKYEGVVPVTKPRGKSVSESDKRSGKDGRQPSRTTKSETTATALNERAQVQLRWER
ncbi:uncharacterized protein IUM83_04131 [Phytophthora cinnamomi]|uniref:uncharacterized protein n=1 Tax=Phytophthora cinnamomi TaxID=4785 RepID=UPI00355AA702|nr:hypothetical protein IUM83_04131 [Phytophthora cinnamomi]